MSDEYADQLTEVMFILFDDHIYDAWLRKAVELKYPLWNSSKSLVKPEAQQDDDDAVVVVESQSPADKGDTTRKTDFDMAVVDVSDAASSNTQPMADPDDTSQDNGKVKSLQKHTT